MGVCERPISTSWRNFSRASACIAPSGRRTPSIHVTEKGDPKFVGLAYCVESEDGLKRLTKAPGAWGIENIVEPGGCVESEDGLKRLTKAPGAWGIENIVEPGGGKRVRLKEPNGYQIDVVCGIAPVPEISVRRQKLNSGESPRENDRAVAALCHGQGSLGNDRSTRGSPPRRSRRRACFPSR